MKRFFNHIGPIPLVIMAAALVIWLNMPASKPKVPTPENDPLVAKSLLHYPDCNAATGAGCNRPETTPCYVNEKYTQFLDEQRRLKAIALIAQAPLDDGKSLEIYRAGTDNSFFVMEIGPDKSGMREACQIASGKNLQGSGLIPQTVALTPPAPVPAVQNGPAPTP